MRVIDRPETGGAGIQRPVTILYSVPTRHVWHEVREAASFYVGASALLLLITSLVIIILLRRALSPIQDLSAEASSISLHSLSFRAPQSAMRMTELRPLAETLSAVIDGLKHSVDQQNRFLGDAAHELKTAVSIVHSSIQLLLMRSRNAIEYTSGLEAVLSDNLRVNELVNRMLDAARFAEGKSEQAVNPNHSTDLVEVSQHALQRLQPILEAQKVRVEMQGELQTPVRSSADDLDVLVSNLLINAAQHSRDGGLIALKVESVDGFALLTVQDHGYGISPEALPHVFERFYREDVSRSRETGGAGLGLSICKAIVEAASGTIEIESTVGARHDRACEDCPLRPPSAWLNLQSRQCSQALPRHFQEIRCYSIPFTLVCSPPWPCSRLAQPVCLLNSPTKSSTSGRLVARADGTISSSDSGAHRLYVTHGPRVEVVDTAVRKSNRRNHGP